MFGNSPLRAKTTTEPENPPDTTDKAMSPVGESRNPKRQIGEEKDSAVTQLNFAGIHSVPEGGFTDKQKDDMFVGLHAYQTAYTDSVADFKNMCGAARVAVPWVKMWLSRKPENLLEDDELILAALLTLRSSEVVTAKSAVTKPGYRMLSNSTGPKFHFLNVLLKDYVFGESFVKGVPEPPTPPIPPAPAAAQVAAAPPATPLSDAAVQDAKEKRAERREAKLAAQEVKRTNDELLQKLESLENNGKTLSTMAMDPDHSKMDFGELLVAFVGLMESLPDEKTAKVSKSTLKLARTRAVDDLMSALICCLQIEQNRTVTTAVSRTLLNALQTGGSCEALAKVFSMNAEATIKTLTDTVAASAYHATETEQAAQVAAVAAAIENCKEEKSAKELMKLVTRRRVKNIDMLDSFMHVLAFYVLVAYPGPCGAIAAERLSAGLKTAKLKLAAINRAPSGHDSMEEFVFQFYEAHFAHYAFVTLPAIKNEDYKTLRRLMPICEDDIRWCNREKDDLLAVNSRTPLQTTQLYRLTRVLSTTKALLDVNASQLADTMRANAAALEAATARLAALEAAVSSQGKGTAKPSPTKTAKPPKLSSKSTFDCRDLMKVGEPPVTHDSANGSVVLDGTSKAAQWCPTVAYAKSTGWMSVPASLAGKTSACNCRVDFKNRVMDTRMGTLTDAGGATSRVTATGCVTNAGHLVVHSV